MSVFISTYWERVRGIFSHNQSSQSSPNPQGIPLINAATNPSPTPFFRNLDNYGHTRKLIPGTLEEIRQIYEIVSSGSIEDKKLYRALYDISDGDDTPLLSYTKDRTLLQMACSYHNKGVAEKMVALILQCSYMKTNSDKAGLLINFQSEKTDGFTALHIAAKQYNSEAALLLIKAGADVTLKSKKGRKPIQLIFKRIPEAITTIYDSAIEKVDEKASVVLDDFKLRVNYTPVCGVHGPKDDETLFLKETALLFECLRESSEKQRFRILEHPLVKLFLTDKWHRMRWLIWILAGLHIIWCFLYIKFTYQLYFSTCPNQGEQSECKPLPPTTSELDYLGWSLLIGSLFFGAKAICNVVLLPRNMRHYIFHFWHRPENSCVWLLVIFSIRGMGRWSSLSAQQSNSVQCHQDEYTIAAVGMIIAFLLVLWQMKKIPFPLLPVHIELFMKVLKNILAFVVAHVGLIFAFSLAFQILMPGRAEYNLFDGGFFKVYTMMTTGEINYDDLFFSNRTETTVPSPLTTKALFVTFQTLMNLAFLGITVGIAIDDCQKLLHQSDMVNFSCRLEEMFLLERLLLASVFQRCCGNCCIAKIIVTNGEGYKVKPFKYTVKLFKGIPKKWRSPIITILDKRSSKPT